MFGEKIENKLMIILCGVFVVRIRMVKKYMRGFWSYIFFCEIYCFVVYLVLYCMYIYNSGYSFEVIF